MCCHCLNSFKSNNMSCHAQENKGRKEKSIVLNFISAFTTASREWDRKLFKISCKLFKISRKLNAWRDSTPNGSFFLAAKGTTLNMKKLKENPCYAASKDTQVTWDMPERFLRSLTLESEAPWERILKKKRSARDSTVPCKAWTWGPAPSFSVYILLPLPRRTH